MENRLEVWFALAQPLALYSIGHMHAQLALRRKSSIDNELLTALVPVLTSENWALSRVSTQANFPRTEPTEKLASP